MRAPPGAERAGRALAPHRIVRPANKRAAGASSGKDPGSILRKRRAQSPAGQVTGAAVPLSIAARQDVVAVAPGGGTGREFGLVLGIDGGVEAWGDNRYGQVTPPTRVRDAVAIAAGCGARGAHCLALLANGEVADWGDNSYGQATINGSGIADIAAGELHSIALTNDGRVVVAGHGTAGGTSPPDLPPVMAIASGAGFCLPLAEGGHVIAWGTNRAGQLDVPTWGREATVIAIAAGDAHALALTDDGKVFAWARTAPPKPPSRTTSVR